MKAKIKNVINVNLLKNLVEMKIRRDSIKKELDALDSSVDELEKTILYKIDLGFKVPETFEAIPKTSSRRNVSWKSELINLLGSSVADQIYESTTPTTYRSLYVKELAQDNIKWAS